MCDALSKDKPIESELLNLKKKINFERFLS